MSRNASGTYSLPLSDVVTGTTISSTWANTTMSDIENEMTDSLSRAGKGSMTGQFKAAAGSLSNPGISFNDEQNSGAYRVSAGVIAFVVGGAEVFRMISTGLNMAAGYALTADDLIVGGEMQYDAEVDNGSSGAAKTIDWTTGNKQKITLSANCTFTFTAPSGPTNICLKVTQDGTTARTITWPATVKWADGAEPTQSTTLSSKNLYSFYFDGTDYIGTLLRDYS